MIIIGKGIKTMYYIYIEESLLKVSLLKSRLYNYHNEYVSCFYWKKVIKLDSIIGN